MNADLPVLALALLNFALAGVLLAVVVLWFKDRGRVEEDRRIEAREWREERRELLTRIQRPDLVPIPKTQTPSAPRRTTDDIHKVGVVQPIRPGPEDNGGDGAGDGSA